MTYKPYSIVTVPFPFTDSAKNKTRPAVVLSSEAHQEQTEHVTLLMITSAKHSQWSSDHPINTLKTTGLSAPSVVRQKIFTIDTRLIFKTIGHLAHDDQKAIVKHLKEHIFG